MLYRLFLDLSWEESSHPSLLGGGYFGSSMSSSDFARKTLLTAMCSVPFGCVSLAVLLFIWPPNVGLGRRLSPWGAIRKTDLFGNVLILAATTLMVFALQEAGAFTYAWNSSVIVLTLSLASLSWVVFITWEVFLGVKRQTMVEPILPLRLITHRVYMGALVCVAPR